MHNKLHIKLRQNTEFRTSTFYRYIVPQQSQIKTHIQIHMYTHRDQPKMIRHYIKYATFSGGLPKKVERHFVYFISFYFSK